jgi:hypothetical protein
MTNLKSPSRSRAVDRARAALVPIVQRVALTAMALAIVGAADARAGVMDGSEPDPSHLTLSIWLDAASGVTADGSGFVSLWEDRSSKNRDVSGAVGRQPKLLSSVEAINGRPAVDFGQDTDDVLRNTTNAAGIFSGDQGTMFALIYAPTPTTAHFIVETPETRRRLLLQRHLPNRGMEIFTQSGNFIGTDSYTRNEYLLVTAVLNGGSSALDILDPVLGATSASGTLDTGLGASLNQFGLGGRADNLTGNNWHGAIAELLIYDEVLSTADRQQVESYLESRYLARIPEPSSAVLLGLGLAAMVSLRRRRRREA